MSRNNQAENNSFSFKDLGLDNSLLQALQRSNYVTPTEIQAQTIPHLLNGLDIVGQAQTGTGKTAAFALPLLSNVNLTKKTKAPQILVLAPTRELAIQVSESFKTYGNFMRGLKVLPIYGGQDYSSQLQKLRRGVHVVVGTPGRVMDHMRSGNLGLNGISSLVLDEADEMLNMGFLEDVKWILEQTPAKKQMALFSATMPSSIRAIAKQHLRNPVEVTVKSRTVTSATIDQQYLITSGRNGKKEALSKILKAEIFDGMLIFVRTRVQTIELAEFLSASGYSCGALNGDIPQNQRLRMVEQLKNGKLDIVVATDVAARGLDVERISHVINYDTPYDTEAYIHRIGRTGRAGREGTAILFLNHQEKRMLRTIERATKGKIRAKKLPTIAEINTRRIESFTAQISTTLSQDCSFYEELLGKYCADNNMTPHRVAAALAKMIHSTSPLLMEEESKVSDKTQRIKKKQETRDKREKYTAPVGKDPKRISKPEPGMDRYRIEIGHQHGVTPSNIVGAIANEADIESSYIGKIAIFDNYSTVDLPYGMPRHILRLLQKVRIYDRMMQIKRDNSLGADQPTNTGRKKRKSPVKSKQSRRENRTLIH